MRKFALSFAHATDEIPQEIILEQSQASISPGKGADL
jgi:hypothetical protein